MNIWSDRDHQEFKIAQCFPCPSGERPVCIRKVWDKYIDSMPDSGGKIFTEACNSGLNMAKRPIVTSYWSTSGMIKRGSGTWTL